MPRWKLAAISFEHFHMGDNLRMAHEHPDVEIVGICDEQPERMEEAARSFQIPQDQIFVDYRQCLESTKPDVVLLCPATAGHGVWTERVAQFGVHVLIEKPFAATLAEADRMLAAMSAQDRQLAINWPLVWCASHRMAKQIIEKGQIGNVIEIHYYDGNRGPLWHSADKAERTPEEVAREKPNSWFYQKSRGGGSLLDYLGYGVTLGTWYMNGRSPIDVTTVVDQPKGLEVDEHSVTIARYESGISKFETRWGTFSDPWTHQPQPKCGFVIVGEEGTISSYDYEQSVGLQTRQCPEVRPVEVVPLEPPYQNPVQYLIHCLNDDRPIEGPLSVAVSRIGQQIVDTAVQSAVQKSTVRLLG